MPVVAKTLAIRSKSAMRDPKIVRAPDNVILIENERRRGGRQREQSGLVARVAQEACARQGGLCQNIHRAARVRSELFLPRSTSSWPVRHRGAEGERMPIRQAHRASGACQPLRLDRMRSLSPSRTAL